MDKHKFLSRNMTAEKEIMLELIKSQSLFYRRTLILTLIGIAGALLSFACGKDSMYLFFWLIGYIPVLWFLWTLNVMFADLEKPAKQLLFLWLLIDFAVLVLFLAFSKHIENWGRARDLDIVVLAIYFPVIIVLIFLQGIILGDKSSIWISWFEELLKFFNFWGDGFTIWIEFSMTAAIQSFVICSIILYVRRYIKIKRSQIK